MAGWTYPTPYTQIIEFAPVKPSAAVDGSTRESAAKAEYFANW
jgi:hypothetical protein